MNESCERDEWDTLFVCHRSSHAYVWVLRDLTHMYESCHRNRCSMSHIWINHSTQSHVLDVNVSCHSYEWDMSHLWISHCTAITESCHTYEWVMSHIWMSHAIRGNRQTNEPMNEWVMALIWMSHVTNTNESWHSREWVMSSEAIIKLVEAGADPMSCNRWKAPPLHFAAFMGNYVAVCCCVLRCVAVCCAAVCCSMLQRVFVCHVELWLLQDTSSPFCCLCR